MLWIFGLVGLLVALFWALAKSKELTRTPSLAMGWRVSDNGNKTRVIGADRITIYGSGHSWKFCIADATKDDSAPYFSESYATESMAMEEAIAFIQGGAPIHQSNQDRRREKAEAALPAQFTNRMEKLAELEKTLSFYEGQTKPNHDKLISFQKRAEKAKSAILRQAADFAASDEVPVSIDEIYAIIDRHNRVLTSIEEVLKR